MAPREAVNRPAGPTVTDEALLAITDQTSQEFADLAMGDKLRWFQLQNANLRSKAETLERKQKGYGLRVSIADGVLTVQIPVESVPQASQTGKNLTVATTRGNIKTAVIYNGKPVTIGLNAFIPA